MPTKHGLYSLFTTTIFPVVQGAIEPYQKSSTNYTFTSLDRELLQDLREMSAENADQSGKGKYLVQINELEPMAFVDLVCKVKPARRHYDLSQSTLTVEVMLKSWTTGMTQSSRLWVHHLLFGVLSSCCILLWCPCKVLDRWLLLRAPEQSIRSCMFGMGQMPRPTPTGRSLVSVSCILWCCIQQHWQSREQYLKLDS